MSRRRHNEWEDSEFEGIFEGLTLPGPGSQPLEPPPPKRKNGVLLPGGQYSDSTDFLIKRISELARLTKFVPLNQPLENIPDDELYGLLEQVTQAGTAVRNALVGGKDSGFPKRRKRYVEHLNIQVFQPKNCILKLVLPPLMPIKFAGSYDVYWNTKLALQEYFAVHEIPKLTGQKLTLIYKRYTKNIHTDALCDNDNWEMKRVTNAITEELFYSDNPANFSFFYTTVESSFEGCEATVIRQENLADFTDYLVASASPSAADSPMRSV